MAEAPTTVALIAGQVARRGEVQRIALLVDRLSRRGVSSVVFCTGGSEELQALGVSSIDDPWLDRPGLRRFSVRRLALDDPDPRLSFSLVHSLHDEVAEAAALLGAALELPWIRSLEDDPPLDGSFRLQPTRLAALIVPDDGLSRRLADRLRVLPDRGIVHVIPPGIELPEPSTNPDASQGSSALVPVIGAVGRFSNGSGFETFLDAIHRVLETGLDVEFLIVGHGPGEARLRRRADRLGLADRLTFAPPAALESAFWRVIRIYCHPAIHPTTAPPLRLAMVAGAPSIAANVPGPADLLADDRGLLVPPGDPAALASSMLELLDSPALLHSLADRSRSWAIPRFHPDLEADALAHLYLSFASPLL